MSTPESRGLQLLFEVSKRSVRCFTRHDMPTYAAALAYRALFALFPFFGFLIVLLGFFRISVFFEWLINQGSFALDEEYAELGEWLVREIQNQSQGALLSSVVVIAVWSVSRGVVSLTKALNTVYGVEEARPAWKRVLLQVFFALGLAVMIILGTALLLIGSRVVGSSIPAHHARRGHCCDRLDHRFAGFLVLPGKLRRLQRALRQPRCCRCTASLPLYFGRGPAIGRRGE